MSTVAAIVRRFRLAAAGIFCVLVAEQAVSAGELQALQGTIPIECSLLQPGGQPSSADGHLLVLTCDRTDPDFWARIESTRSQLLDQSSPVLLMVTPEAHEVMVDAAPNLMSTVGGNVVVADTEVQVVKTFLKELTSQASPVAEAKYLFENIGIFVATEAVQTLEGILCSYLEGETLMSTGIGFLVATKSLENRLPSRGLLLQKLKSFLPEYLPDEPNNVALTRKVLNGFG